MPKIILKSGYPSVKEASSDPAWNKAYIDKTELGRLRQRKYWVKQRAIIWSSLPIEQLIKLKRRLNPRQLKELDEAWRSLRR